jgi:hypothetical protein
VEEVKRGVIVEPPVWTYKSNQRFSKIPSCTLDIIYLRKLFEIFSNINKEAAQIELSNVEKWYEHSSVKPSKEEIEKIKKDVLESYRIHIQIFGAKGEFLSADSPSILKEEALPDFVTNIKFDNSFFYKTKFNGRNPQSLLSVELDLNKPPLVDFTTNPSLSTTNNSFIQVLGENETWVEGAHEKVLSSLRERKTKRAWLHRNNAYDLFLWILILPISFWNLRKIDLMVSVYLSKISSVFTVALYVYVFIIILNLFRLGFNYVRWLFPYLELKTPLKKGAIVHRSIFVLIFLPVMYALVKDLILYVIRYIRILL